MPVFYCGEKQNNMHAYYTINLYQHQRRKFFGTAAHLWNLFTILKLTILLQLCTCYFLVYIVNFMLYNWSSHKSFTKSFKTIKLQEYHYQHIDVPFLSKIKLK